MMFPAEVQDDRGKIGGNALLQPYLSCPRVLDQRAVISDDGRVQIQLLGKSHGR